MAQKYILVNKSIYVGVLNQGNPKAAILPANTLLELDDNKPLHAAVIKELKALKGKLIPKRMNTFTKKVEEDIRWVEELTAAEAKKVSDNIVTHRVAIAEEKKEAKDITASNVKKK